MNLIKTYVWVLALGLCFSLQAQDAVPQSPAPAASDETNKAPDVTRTNDVQITDAVDEDEAMFMRGRPHAPLVSIGHDAELRASETSEAVVVVGGSAKVRGKVGDSVVVIGGDANVDAYVRDAVVAVFGSVKLGTNANVRNAVAIGGRVEMAEGAKVRDSHFQLPIGFLGEGARNWFMYCALRLRPLAPQVPWVWGVAGVFLLIYFLIALLFGGPVRACVGELTRRPATTFFTGLLAKLLLPLCFAILIATGVGVFILPFAFAAVLFGAFIGKTALLETLGGPLVRRFGRAEVEKPLLAFLIGAVLLIILYNIPLLGLITLGVTSIWGLGGAVTAALGAFRKERKTAAPAPPAGGPPPSGPGASSAPSQTPPPSPVMAGSATMAASAGIVPMSISEPVNAGSGASVTAGQGSGPGVATPEAPIPPPPAAPPAAVQTQTLKAAQIQEALAHPRASFWERIGAGFLDIVLVSIVSAFLHLFGWTFFAFLAYFVLLWTFKGTTVGGVVLNLKVVRVDGRPMDLLVSLVRGLAGAFSIVMFFLGFLCIFWDREKQGWHDKIAGTVVVRLPRGTPLVCV